MRDYTVTIVTAPASEPVTASDAQEHLEVSGDTALLEAFIEASRMAAESYTRRAFITQTLRLNLDGFPQEGLEWWDGVRDGALTTRQLRVLELPRPPLQSVGTVTYYDTDDASNTFAASNYVVITDREPGVIQLKTNKAWPVDLRSRNAVTIDYDAGYGNNASDVPAGIKRAILMQVAMLYSRRDPAIASESIDNASTTYVSESARWGDANLAPIVRQLLDPYRIVKV